ncbi:DNA translocase domain-containing protein, FtsK-like [Desulfonema limicola]|uniref:DNA translocase domain-containing protein, FtsK-like n=1 Tax=Desulfonema limicola TaxID=45656 RepID=A0A975GF55_9BACT|nr:FtsK/SpoIIIE domain-containing protein [Desulfonema limicola]QTA78897.1 DNA translocase domain-containing protein, FtsK-like [Desulfonema limicola]
MSKIYTSFEDEKLIDSVLQKDKGLMCSDKLPKWTVLRLALAQSLKSSAEFYEENQDQPEAGGKEYNLRQVTGKGQENDFTDLFCTLLSVYHRENLFADDNRFRTLLQKHIRRGLRDMRTSWKDSHDFHEYLYQELFTDSDYQKSIIMNLREKIVSAINEIGVSGNIEDQLDGPRITRFLISLSDVNDLDRLRKGLEKLSFLLGLQKQGIFLQSTNQERVAGLDIPRSQDSWYQINGNNLREWVLHTPHNMILPAWPGVDVLGKPFIFDITEAPHILVGGTTGSGKSICLHTLLLSLLLSQSSDQLKICLIDPKHVEFTPYAALPHHMYGKVITSSEEALRILTQLVNEMEERESILASNKVRDIIEGEIKGVIELPRIVVFVEELADIFIQSRAIETPLARLAQKGRAAGIHLILSTQRPDAETFSGLLRSNIPSRIALTVQKSSESKIILDEVGAERLSGKGDMLIKISGSNIIRVHGVKIKQNDIEECISKFRRNE